MARFVPLQKMNDYGSNKSNIGKMDGCPEASPSVGQACADRHVQMARELGLNPDKLGKIDNHRQEPWKAPLPQFIEDIYYKRFKREQPETVRPLKQILKEMEFKKKLQKEKKEERRKQRVFSSDSAAE